METLRQEDARVGAQFSGAAATCTLYDEGSKTWLCDLRRLLDATAAFDGADPVAVKEALDSLVTYLAAEADSSNAGISLFCPKSDIDNVQPMEEGESAPLAWRTRQWQLTRYVLVFAPEN